MIFVFFFNDTATTEIYTLSLHDALPICPRWRTSTGIRAKFSETTGEAPTYTTACGRSEEHTSELQSQSNLVCRLLLEKKKLKINSKGASLTEVEPRCQIALRYPPPAYIE